MKLDLILFKSPKYEEQTSDSQISENSKSRGGGYFWDSQNLRTQILKKIIEKERRAGLTTWVFGRSGYSEKREKTHQKVNHRRFRVNVFVYFLA